MDPQVPICQRRRSQWVLSSRWVQTQDTDKNRMTFIGIPASKTRQVKGRKAPVNLQMERAGKLSIALFYLLDLFASIANTLRCLLLLFSYLDLLQIKNQRYMYIIPRTEVCRDIYRNRAERQESLLKREDCGDAAALCRLCSDCSICPSNSPSPHLR